MRPVKQIIEFKQIIGRGTRTFDGKDYFTIYDFVDAHQRFLDPEWDGEPENPVVCISEESDLKLCKKCEKQPCICEIDEPTECEICGNLPCICKKKIRVKLKNGKELEIQHITETMFWDESGKPISTEELLNKLIGELPNLFKNESELRKLWSNPNTRKALLEKLEEAGYGVETLNSVTKVIDAENSDLFDVLQYLFPGGKKPITRAERVEATKTTIFNSLNNKEKEFIDFVLRKYIESGVGELDRGKLSSLLKSMHNSQEDGIQILGGDPQKISELFINFQHHLYDVA